MEGNGSGKIEPAHETPAAHQRGHADNLAISRPFTDLHDQAKKQVAVIIAEYCLAVVAVHEREAGDQVGMPRIRGCAQAEQRHEAVSKSQKASHPAGCTSKHSPRRLSRCYPFSQD